MNLIQTYRDWRTRAKTPWWREYDVRSNEDGFQLRSTVPGLKDIEPLKWANVCRAEVFKRDLLTTDLICIKLTDGNVWLEANEEMLGWTKFITEAEARLVGFLPRKEWWERVMKPTFNENREVVFDAKAT